jgi:serine protease
MLISLWLHCTPSLAAELSTPFAKAAPPPASGQSSSAIEIQTDRLIVKYKESSPDRHAPATSQAEKLSRRAGMSIRHHHAMSGSGQVFKLPGRMSRDAVDAVARKVAEDPAVEYAVPDTVMSPLLVPNDTDYVNQWHYKSPDTDHEIAGINLPPAWEMTTGSSSVAVAVIDTGIVNHADLQGRILPGYNFISDPTVAGNGIGRSADASDLGDWTVNADGSIASTSSWHGTHVTGTIAATANNGAGVAGINWNSKILPVRVLGKGGGYSSDIIDGMRWAAGLSVPGVPANATPARVLNLSLGGQGACYTAFQAAIDEVNAAGAVVVVAAGNSSADAATGFPGNCNGVIPVAAIGRLGGPAYYTNYGSTVKIAAPGGDQRLGTDAGVLSTLNAGTTSPIASPGGDTYGYYQGTSQATPHVAGVASLMLSVNPALSPEQILGIMQSTSRPFPTNTGLPEGDCSNTFCGSGIVDAYQAVRAVSLKSTLINLTPLSLTFAVPADGSTPATQTVQISNPGSGILNWSVASSAPWLHVTPSSGQDAGTLTISIDAAPPVLLERPTASITITASGAVNSPTTIPVAVGFLPKLLAPMPSGQLAPTLTAVNGKLYAIGGWPSFTPNQIYDVTSDTWSSGKPNPTGVSDTDAAVINGKIYIPGGRNLTGAVTNRLDIYDPSTDQWSSGAPMPKALMFAAVQAVNGKLYVLGGQDATTGSSAVYAYDPSQNSWSTSPASGYFWGGSGSGVIDGKIYLYGGFYAIKNPAIFDPATNSYSQLPVLNLARNELAGAVVGGKAYGIAGTALTVSRDSEVYDPAENRWKFSPLLLSQPRWGHKAATIGTTIYVMGGFTAQASGLSNLNEAYTIQNVSAPQPVNGVCGSAHGQPLSDFPMTDLCASGTASVVTGSGPWSWSCGGVYGGTSVNCSTYPRLYFAQSSILAAAFHGKSYVNMLTAAGGTPPYTLSSPFNGSLPAGLSLDTATGYISGVPLVTGTSAFSVTLQDSLGYSFSQSFTLNVKLQPAVIPRTPSAYFYRIQDAFDNCEDGESIHLTGSYQFRGDLRFDRAITAALSGGYSDDYTTNSGSSLVHGKLTISSGKLKLSGIILQ